MRPEWVAAIEAAKLGANVTVIEKKNKPGKKILATGTDAAILRIEIRKYPVITAVMIR